MKNAFTSFLFSLELYLMMEQTPVAPGPTAVAPSVGPCCFDDGETHRCNVCVEAIWTLGQSQRFLSKDASKTSEVELFSQCYPRDGWANDRPPLQKRRLSRNNQIFFGSSGLWRSLTSTHGFIYSVCI